MRCLSPIAAAVLLSLAAGPVRAQAGFASNAPFAFLKDAATGQVLYAQNADERMPPASMAKMMTVYVAFDLIRRGEVRLDQKIRVRAETWRKWHGPSAGSTMFLSPDEEVTVENLLNGIVTLSGNDACVVLAEGLAGTEAQYVIAMNAMAGRLGLKGSRFANTNGWPHPDEYVTPRDLATIAERTINDFPDLYRKFYSNHEFTWGRTMGRGVPIVQANRDPLLGRVAGADGLKTGHTDEAGYGFTGSAVRDGRRLVMVVAGLTSPAERIAESVRFMEWGLTGWKAVPVSRAGRVIDTVPVWNGSAGRVGVTTPRDVNISAPRFGGGPLQAKILYVGPVRAPIAKGQRIAELVIAATGMPTAHIPLVAAEPVAVAGPLDRVVNGMRRLFGGE